MINLKRFILEELIKWKNSKYRKPLILKGARQIGKTYILKQFGKENYEDIAYFNFDHDEDLQNLFESSKNPQRILEQLTFIYKKEIRPEKTLIIFDEIQECPNALNSLKYFQEEANEYHIVCAGSLLGIRLSHTSFPVGKVEFLNMYPMTFSEFLIADNCENLVEYMKSIKSIEKIPDIFFNQLEEKLKAYFIIGGMPEAVQVWVNEKNIELVERVQQNILKAYESDFSKHTQNNEANKISLIWNSIPSQLAKENKKFLYQTIKEGARAREYEGALNWLNDANLIYKVYNVTKTDLPLIAYNDLSAFKIYMNDVGLLRNMANLDSRIVIEGDRLFEEFKGALTEQYVLQELKIKDNLPIAYWGTDNGTAEIDFVIQDKDMVIPIEVKATVNLKAKSLASYRQKYEPKKAVRTSLAGFEENNGLFNIPLYMIESLVE